MIPITIQHFVSPGGSGKAEGFADGEWANHRQSFGKLRRGAALAAATQDLIACYEELMHNRYKLNG